MLLNIATTCCGRGHKSNFWGWICFCICGCIQVQSADLQVFNMLSYLGRGLFHLYCPQVRGLFHLSLIHPASHSSVLSALMYKTDPFRSQFRRSPSHSGLLSGADEVRFDHLSVLRLLAINVMCCHFIHPFLGAETLPSPQSQRRNQRGEERKINYSLFLCL